MNSVEMSINALTTSREGWNVQASSIAKRTHNPIRSIVENIVVEPNPDKQMIALSIGDPTTFGNLKPAREVIEAVQESVESQLYNGYAPSTGYEEARRAVAEYSSNDQVKVEAKDVILCSGCSCALDLCITALAREGQNILIPRPGFSIYRTLAEGLGITVRSYNLRPEHGWEIDLDDLEAQIDESTAAILINNPSNPCGSVFSREHLLDILDVAAKYYVPVIADEIYEHMVFPGRTFYSLASLSTEVPILSCSGLTKRFLVPGWRMGWIIIHDRQNILDREIKKALQCLSQRIIGSNTIVQGALPKILKNTPQSFFDNLTQTLDAHATLTYNYVSKIPGLKPIMPDGAMYMMVHIDLPSFPEFNTELEFVQRLLAEESVFCLPGQGIPLEDGDTGLFEINSILGSSRTSSIESIQTNDETVEEEQLHNEIFMETDTHLDWINKQLYDSASFTTGETVHEILSFFFANGLTKRCLEKLLLLLDFLLPKPNNLSKTKYQLLKLLDTLLPPNGDLVKKHQICENCSHYLGPICPTKPITVCDDCNSTKVFDIFIEYNLKQLLKNAFEVRDLKNLIDIHNKQIKNIDENTICDFTSGMEYTKFKRETLKGEFDLCLIWNTDGAPVSKCSNGQIWPIQVKVLNIPPKNRRSYQFLTGLYYSNESKPPMNSFLKPFADSLKDLYENGIEWFDKSRNKTERSIVIAPIATLDCPARASVQNMMRCNGECGCTLCEHPGFTCPTGLGHNRVYPVLENAPLLRTHESIIEQANIVINNGLEHVKGVKGVSITAIIPCFDCASSFVPDYMHATLLGVSRMLFSLWFDGKNHKKKFYIKKSAKMEIDTLIRQISPPDFIVRTPRQLKDIKYWKATEIRDFTLFYFPIILKNKLSNKYYKHFLLLVYGTRILLQEKINLNEINIAEELLSLFAENVVELYGLEKCSFNVHQLTHMAECVRKWGPLWVWSAFSFEDAIGYYKKINHGPNKVDMEVVNTLKMFNAYYVLKEKLNIISSNKNQRNKETVLGLPKKYVLNMHEIEALQCVTLTREPCNLNGNIGYIFIRAKKGLQVFTSNLYSRQKKRMNSMVSWNNKSQFGIIQFFININNSIFAVIRELTRNFREINLITPQIQLNLCDILIPMRLTYCYYAVPLSLINEKLLYVNNYVCIPPNSYERK